MNIKRIWVLGILSVVGAFLFVACGGGGSTTPTLVPTPVADSGPAPARDGAAGDGPAQPTEPAATQEPTADQADASAAYAWQIETVDTNAGKPSLAVDANGVPHIAYILEAQPGFVKYAIRNGEAWDISNAKSYINNGCPVHDLALDRRTRSLHVRL